MTLLIGSPSYAAKSLRINLAHLNLPDFLDFFGILSTSMYIYHHFREHVNKGFIEIVPMYIKDQIADNLIKALMQNYFVYHQIHMCRQ